MTNGLKPLPKDSRDFVLGAAYILPPLSELPEEFSLGHLTIKNQGDSDMCTAYATCGASEIQEGVALLPEYSFALSKELSGDPQEWGQDLRVACKAHTKVGAVEESEREELQLHPIRSEREIKCYPVALRDKAIQHRKKSYFKVEGPYDAFDDIRATIWKFRMENRAVPLGILWNYNPASPIITTPTTEGTGHAMYATGWTKDGLEVVNSMGEFVGDQGVFYISREVINRWVPEYGAFMFSDLTPEEYMELIRPKALLSFKAILEGMVELLTGFLNLKRQGYPPVKVDSVLPPATGLDKFCRAVQKHEGWFEGSRSYRNNNPGNFRFSTLLQDLGAVGKDAQGFCVFETYESGFQALRTFVTYAAENRLRAYKNCTIRSFFLSYAPPGDNNNSSAYAAFVANFIGVSLDTKVADAIKV
jgi:hypothetical protein